MAEDKRVYVERDREPVVERSSSSGLWVVGVILLLVILFLLFGGASLFNRTDTGTEDTITPSTNLNQDNETPTPTPSPITPPAPAPTPPADGTTTP